MKIRFYSKLFLLYMLVAMPVAPAKVFAAPETELLFGVYQSDKASVMYKTFSPIIKKLSTALGGTKIRLKIFKDYAEGIDALAKGEVDFVRFGPASYILTKEKNPDIRLLVMEEKKGGTRFKGVIITRKDSAIKSISDLKGKKFAFGNENSTIGRYLSQAELIKNAIHGSDLEKFDYLGRHDKVASAVGVGDYDAGAVKNKTFKKAEKEGKIRALVKFDNITKPWIVRAGLDDALFESIKNALISLVDEKALKKIKISGFRETSDAEYEFVRKGMKVAEAF